MTAETASDLSGEAEQVLRELNPWWADPRRVRPEPPQYRRPRVIELRSRLRSPKGLIEVVRGPRQVGKTTGIYQIIQDFIRDGVDPQHILFVRFDLELLREEPASLRRILRWFVQKVRRSPLSAETPTYLFLDEIHKLRRWHEEIKHIGDTFPLRMMLTGSSSVLVARGGRESLAGRVFTTEMPPFSFREVLECWKPDRAAILPPSISLTNVFDGALRPTSQFMEELRPQQKLALSRGLDRYYNRGGYPRLHSGEVEDDRWADYLAQTVFENVLGADIPDLFPVESPQLLRFIYMNVARMTGSEIAQNKLAQLASASGLSANQPTVGKYLHYLTDALLIREFRRYPLSKKLSAKVPAKITVTDLGVRNAIFRGAPSLFESDPAVLGPLVETMVQTCLHGHNLHVHFFRDYETPGNRRSSIREVDFVVEQIDGSTLPVEVKFRKRLDEADLAGLRLFQKRFKPSHSVVVTRDITDWDAKTRTQFVPLQTFLLAF